MSFVCLFFSPRGGLRKKKKMTAKKIKKTTRSVQKKVGKKQTKKAAVKIGRKNNKDSQIIVEIVDRLIEGRTADTMTEWLVSEGFSALAASELIDKAVAGIRNTCHLFFLPNGCKIVPRRKTHGIFLQKTVCLPGTHKK